MNAGTLPGVGLPLCTRDSIPADLYALMLGIRLFERSLLDMFSQGVLVGTTHTCLGQEPTAVGVVAALDRTRDIVVGNHRSHGHFLAYCGDVERLYLEVMGKPGGVCGGRGGSQHLHYRNFYSNGIQGGIAPMAIGLALAEKLHATGAVVTVFLGDGTLGEGAVYESLNIASLWQLPVLFVVDDNGYAQSTPRALQLAGAIRARPEAFDICTDELHSMDAREIREAALRCVDRIRADGGPQCLVLHTYRLGPHSKGDDHRDANELAHAWEADPLSQFASTIAPHVVSLTQHTVQSTIDTARTRALAAVTHA